MKALKVITFILLILLMTACNCVYQEKVNNAGDVTADEEFKRIEQVWTDGIIRTDTHVWLDSIAGYIRHIYCFGFLNDFERIESLTITNVYISPDLVIPLFDSLLPLREIRIQGIFGATASDLLADAAFLPNLLKIGIDSNSKGGEPIPHIPSLRDLHIVAPDAMRLIQYNTHIAGILHFGSIWRSLGALSHSGASNMYSLDGVQGFANLQALSVPPKVQDLSPVSQLISLQILDVHSVHHIESLMPLYELPNLQDILISERTYMRLSSCEREAFPLENNRFYDAVQIFFGDIFYNPPLGDFDSRHGHLRIENEVIECFRFLQITNCVNSIRIINSKILSFDYLAEYAPNLTSLSIDSNYYISEGLVLPHLPYLTYLSIGATNTSKLYLLTKNNTHITENLTVLFDLCEETGINFCLAPLSEFSSLRSLRMIGSAPTLDISFLNGTKNLRRLYLSREIVSVNSLAPIVNLPRLRFLFVGQDVIHSSEFIEESNQLKAMPWYLMILGLE